MDKTNHRRYDIRGEYGSEITKQDAFALGAAYARSRSAKVVCTTYDTREGSAQIYDYLCDGLAAGGAQVMDLGPGTIDLLTYATATLEHEGSLPNGGIMVTGGRNAGMNTGFKIIGPEGQAVSPEAIEELMAEAKTMNAQDIAPKHIEKIHTSGDIANLYAKYVKTLLQGYGNWPTYPDREEFVVLIETAAVQQMALWYLIEKSMKMENVPISFIVKEEGHKVHPDPFDPARSSNFQAMMVEQEFDFGLSFDADGGGFAAYGGNGALIPPAYIGAYLAALIKGRYRDARTIVDHRTVYPMLYIGQKEGYPVQLSVPGSPPMRYSMRDTAAHFGAGGDGRYYFGDMWWTESGMLAAWLTVHLAYTSPTPMNEVVDGLKFGINSLNELRFTTEDPEAVIADFKQGLSGQASVTSNHPRELVARSTIPNFDFRLCLRVHEADGTLRLNLEGNGVNPEAMEKLMEGFHLSLAQQGEPV